MAGCISTFSKYILFIFNFIIAICAIVLMVFGILYIVDEDSGVQVFDDVSVGGFAIAVSVIILLISFFGCCGAIKQNTCLLTTYAIILIIIFVVQLVLGIMAIVKINDEDQFHKDMNKLVLDFFKKTDKDSIEAFHDMEEGFECCGARGPIDYPTGFPPSCCEDQPKLCLKPFKKGCGEAFADAIEDNINVIGWVAIAFSIVEVCGAVFAFLVRKKRSDQYA